MQNKTISILIPALNEERNILNLLNDIKNQTRSENYEILEVLVISDGSTDKTNDIVKEFARDNKDVSLVINEKRMGKIYSVSEGYKKLHTDYVVMFDADVRLKNNAIEELFATALSSGVKLIGGNPVPYPPKSFLNLAEQASMFSWHLVQAIKFDRPDSIYSAHGRILMLSKFLYKNIKISSLSTPGDDQFIYIESGGSFKYCKEAIVFYRLPSTINDYLSQNIRFRKAQEMKVPQSSELRALFSIKNKYTVLLRTIGAYPLKFIIWTVLYSVGLIKYHQQKIFTLKNDEWGVANSTK